MQYTQAQIDRANAVSLEDFLRTQGETLIKSGREYRWKEHDSLTVRGNKWFRHSQSKGGYPIDFVMEFYGKSFPEAVQLLTGESGEGQTHSDRTLPGLTSPIRSDTRETATSFLPLKHRLTCYRSSAIIRRTGRQGAILPWAAFREKPLTVFFLNARTSEKCSSALTATPQEVKPAPGWHRTFPARSPSFALSR